jgi:predicted transcriptional regulator of viral defense system
MFINPPSFGGFATENDIAFTARSLSPQESRIVLALNERGRQETTRAEIVELLGVIPKAADHVIESLRRKGWLERATWGKYLLIPPEQGPEAGQIVEIPQVGGLHHRYERRAV